MNKVVEYIEKENRVNERKAAGYHREWIRVKYFPGVKPRETYAAMENYFSEKGYRTYFFRDHSYFVVCF